MSTLLEQLRSHYLTTYGEAAWATLSARFHLLCVCSTFQTPVALRGEFASRVKVVLAVSAAPVRRRILCLACIPVVVTADPHAGF